MANIFDAFDAKVNLAEIEKQKKEAAENTFEKVPAGRYTAKIENMELGLTKDKRPMFKVQMRLVDGSGAAEKAFLAKYPKKKPCVFMNRVIFGTKNDGSMIASVEGWLKNLFPDDEPIVFTSYSTFAEDILDAAEDCEGVIYDIDYDPDEFNNIYIIVPDISDDDTPF